MAKHTQFMVDGKPFFSLGGQVHNACAHHAGEIEDGIAGVKAIGGNTLAVPVHWEIIEPQEGLFDFSSVGDIIGRCRSAGLKLILLWFGTWKNGTMKYTPAWVKEDRKRFRRVQNETGFETSVLSSHCQATFEADKRAFCQLMAYIRDVDAVQKTVIGVQVENEPGIEGGTARDWSELGNAAMAEKVPDQLIAFIEKRGKGPVYDCWQACGAVHDGDWTAVFGDNACEYMTAWSIASYIDDIAAAGKAIYDVLMYVNVWLDYNLWQLPGKCVLSGGAVTRVLDIWKCRTRAIDLIAPDNYKLDRETYETINTAYAREDNPYYCPESGANMPNIRGIFRAIAELGSIGHHYFGIDVLCPRLIGNQKPEARQMMKSMKMVSAVLPLIEKYRGSGKIYAVTQNTGRDSQCYTFGDWMCLVEFGKGLRPTDYMHLEDRNEVASEPGRGLVFQVGEKEFYLVGDGMTCHFNRTVKGGRIPQLLMSHDFQATNANYSVCEQGWFDAQGNYVADRCRNGDENDFGVWLSADVGVVHIRMAD